MHRALNRCIEEQRLSTEPIHSETIPTETPSETIHTGCCIIGGGPAGVMLGYLLAREGVRVTVLEKHADFFRDFRGDTVHPSTLEILDEAGIADDFLKLPHQQVTSVTARIGDFDFPGPDLSHLRTRFHFVAFMPQWDFLDFLSAQAKRYPEFDLRMEHEAIDLTSAGGRITGVVARTPQGVREIRAELVVACDGRRSVTRRLSNLSVVETGVPIDVLWFRISRRGNDPEQLFGRINYGKALVLINRGDYFQTALLIRKDSFDHIKQQGLEGLRRGISQIAPFLSDRVAELDHWDQFKLLSVQINHLKRWSRPGLLCIGDAAHAMSPVFGIGINLAIQDAVAAANILAPVLRHGECVDRWLPEVQRRRAFPTRIVQRLQVMAHYGIRRVFDNPGPVHVPPILHTIVRAPILRRGMARLVAEGIRAEHLGVVPKPRARIGKGMALLLGAGVGMAVGWALLARRRPRVGRC
jgi:2-polyprenyl-6-methoxyphenol hydroxylase-like FAD-dependent oxidoreductase